MYKSIDVMCTSCESIHIQLADVPYGESLPNQVTCEKCGAEDATRLISCHIAKKEIEEKTHGGELIGGKIVRRLTGAKEARDQWLLKKGIKKAIRSGENEAARDMQTELSRKAAEGLKQL